MTKLSSEKTQTRSNIAIYLKQRIKIKIKALTPQKNLQSLDTDVSAIMESEGFAVRQYSGVNIEPKILEELRTSMLTFKKIQFIR